MDESGAQLLHEALHAQAKAAAAEIMSSDPESISQLSLASSPHNPLEALNFSLSSGKFSDLIVLHGGRKWNAHKVVVASQSAVLESMIEKLPPTSILDLTSYEEDAISLMMEYLYNGAYTTTPIAPDFDLPKHIKVFALANTLSIPGLGTIACAYFSHALSTQVTSLDVYFEAIKFVYTSTTSQNPALRLVVVHTAISELRSLLATLPVHTAFHAVTAEVPEFQADIFAVLLETHMPVQPEYQVLCKECGPRDDGDGYVISKVCKCCAEERELEFY